MKNSFKNSRIPLLSKVAKATMVALPAMLLTVNTAYAEGSNPTDPNFPTFEPGEKWLNYVTDQRPGKNLIPNPSFGLCTTELDQANIYTLTAGKLGGDNRQAATHCVNSASKKNNAPTTWSWYDIGLDPHHQGKGVVAPVAVNEADAAYDPVPFINGAPDPDTSYTPLTTMIGKIAAAKTMRLIKPIEVEGVSEIYVSYEQACWGAKNWTSQIVLEGMEPITIEESCTGGSDNFQKWVKSTFVHTFTTPYSGTVDLHIGGASTNTITRIDNIFLSTDVIIYPPPPAPTSDTDNDGVDDIDDAFPLDAAASVDADKDGIPDSWNATKSELDSTTGLTYLDAFPDDIAASMDSDSDGFPDDWNDIAVCNEDCRAASPLTLDAFDNDAAASVDTDADGQPDDWNENKTAADSTSDPVLVLDLDDDDDGYTDAEEIAAETDPLNGDKHPADTDGDGWINANNKGWEVNDLYPTSSKFGPLLTNVITGYGADAESTTIVAKDASSTNTEWEYTGTAAEGNISYEIADVTGHDGLTTKAFKLEVLTGGAGYIQLTSPTLTMGNLDANFLRLAGWVKVTATDDSASHFTGGNKVVQMSATGGKLVNDVEVPSVNSKFFKFAEGKADRAIINQDISDNNGWTYFQRDFTITDYKSTKANINLLAKVAGYVALFDDLELNLVYSRDSDGDEILDGPDNDDDNDGTIDGLDATPLGDDTLDSDGDGILDAYDNDLDGDGFANAFTDTIAPELTLSGSPSLAISQGDAYVEQGATAVDNIDDDLTVVVTGAVNTSVFGTYIIKYNVSDALGNAAIEITRTISVTDKDSDGDGVVDNEDAFPNDATETTDSDRDGTGNNSDAFPNDATETTDSDGDGTGDNSDAFPNDATETVDTDGDGTGDNSDPDIDGDGVLNENDVDDFNAVTRENDLDRDGIADDVDSDGVNILDAIAAIDDALLANGALSLDATAIETDITATVSAFVSQVLADAGIAGVDVNGIEGEQTRRSGSYDLTVTLNNTVGSLKTFDAVLNITPNVSIPQTVSVRADAAIAINLTLSGQALSYPVTFAYRFEPIAEDAVAIDEGILTILEGQTHTLTLLGQMDGDYQVVFSEGDDRNAAIVGNAVTLIYAEANIAPAFDVALMNNGTMVTVLDQSATDAAIAITITDIDMLTEHNVAVTLNGVEVFNASNDVTNPVEVVAIDVATLGAGEHELMVVVTELATEDLFSTSQTITLIIAGDLPVLDDTVEVTLEDGTVEVVIVDTDGDGVSDAEEGFSDTDGDGIADYLDNSNTANKQKVSTVVVDDQGNEITASTSITVDEGLTIVIGDTLKILDSGLSDDIGVELTNENYVQVLQVSEDDQAAVDASLVDVKAFLIPMIDFKIKGVDAGATVNMIMQLPAPLPLKSAYRKIQDNGSLVAFDTSNGNAIMSAMSDAQGDCPAADSEAWQMGLVKGNDCVKVAFVDGGANDADGTVNGVIVDPAIMVEVNSVPVVSIAGLASVNEETPVSYVATVTDTDGDTLTYSWTQIQGATASLVDADTATLIATATAADGEDLVFMLTVSDGIATTTETITVFVNDIGPTVSASMSASAVNGGDEVTLTANVSDHDAANIAYRWVQTSGEAVTLTGENSAVATFTAPNSDTTLTFELLVSDYDNRPKTRIVSVDVSAVEETKKDSGGSFGASVLLFLAGFVGLRRKVKRA